MNFTYALNKVGSSTLELQLSGNFDETSSLPKNIDLRGILSLYVDFDKLEFINSGGIKLWVKFAQQLEKYENLKVYFRKCKRAVIHQVNLIEGFLPKNAEVISIYVPVFCNKCENNFNVFQDVKKMGDNLDDIIQRVEAPDCPDFPKCKNKFEIDIMPELFFKFLKK